MGLPRSSSVEGGMDGGGIRKELEPESNAQCVVHAP